MQGEDPTNSLQHTTTMKALEVRLEETSDSIGTRTHNSLDNQPTCILELMQFVCSIASVSATNLDSIEIGQEHPILEKYTPYDSL
jgi:hypothetical protein